MPFFIRGKRKNEETKQKTHNKTSKKSAGNKVRLGTKKAQVSDDEEIDSDSEDEKTVQNNYKYSSESEAEETVQEKRLRLAHKYLEEIEKEEKRRLETDEIDKDVISNRLKEDVLEQAGRLRKKVADLYLGIDEPHVLHCKEHSRSLTCLVVSYDNKYIFSASADYNIVKWSIASRSKVKVVHRTDVHGHKKTILSLSISSDGKFLASGDATPKLIIWNPENMSYIHTFSGHRGPITGLAFRKDTHQLFSCSSDKTVKIWSLDEMSYVETLFGHQDGVTGIDALSRDRAVTAGGRDNTVRIWKVVEESHLILNGHKESIDCIRLLNEDHFVTGGESGNVSLWSSLKKKPLWTENAAHGVDRTSSTPNWVLSVATLLHCDLFATGGYDGYIRLYKCDERFKRFDQLFEIPLAGNINCLQFTSDGEFLIAGVGKEQRQGRWHVEKDVKNAVILIPLLKEPTLNHV